MMNNSQEMLFIPGFGNSRMYNINTWKGGNGKNVV